MKRVGLVDQLEVELERMISKGWLPADGRLPSERTLAELRGVSRSTAREALVRLKSRGLVVRHPGRLSRALPLDESLTLENLGVALHGNDSEHPERQVLLEGYFALKRELTLELLVACCEGASKEQLDRVDTACFLLVDVVRHREERLAWVLHEFEVLRQAALAARRPGQLLLVQSLERAFHGMASWVLPHLDCQALLRWARLVRDALFERNVEALKQRLPALLEAYDRCVLGGMAPACETPQAPAPEQPPRQTTEPLPHEAVAPAPASGATREAAPALVPRPPPEQAVTSSSDAGLTHEAAFPGTSQTPHEAGNETPPESPLTPARACPLCCGNAAGVRGAAPRSGAESAGGDPPAAPSPNWSDFRTSSNQAPPTGVPLPGSSLATDSADGASRAEPQGPHPRVSRSWAHTDGFREVGHPCESHKR